MNDFLSQGGLIPIWILGAALALGVMLTFMKTGRDQQRDLSDKPARDRHPVSETPVPARQGI